MSSGDSESFYSSTTEQVYGEPSLAIRHLKECGEGSVSFPNSQSNYGKKSNVHEETILYIIRKIEYNQKFTGWALNTSIQE